MGRAVALLAVGVASMLGGLIWYLGAHQDSPVLAYRGTWVVTFTPASTLDVRKAAVDACSSLPGVVRSGVTEPPGPRTGFTQGPFLASGITDAAKKSSLAQAAAIFGCLKAQPGVASVTADDP